jgi:Fe-S oxidoreductase
MDGNLQAVLEKLGRYGNSFGQSARNRAKWAKELPFKIKDARKEEVEYLWFVGDFASFDPSLQENTRIAARIFFQTGIDFGILYEDESNAGNDVRRVGEEGLFELLVEKNLKAFDKASFQRIVTTDPHSLNTLRNEYPQFGADLTVLHYTELLSEFIRTGRIQIENSLDYTATYHDPCYLARYNGVTDAPREVMRSLGLRMVEMPRNGENTFCCGAGGGRIWMGDSGGPGRPAEMRIKEALELGGVDVFVVTCPKDVTMFRDAVKTLGVESRIAVKELLDLVEEALGVDAEVAAVGAEVITGENEQPEPKE